jgi:TPR repeat protein
MTDDPFNLDPFTVLPDENGKPCILGESCGNPIYKSTHPAHPGIWKLQIIEIKPPASTSELDHERITKSWVTERAQGGGYFLATEFPQNGTLRTVIERNGAMEWPVVRWIALQIADALEHAHAHHVSHGGLALESIALSQPWPELQISLSGFQTSGATSEDLRATASILRSLLTGDAQALTTVPPTLNPEAREILSGLLGGSIATAADLTESLVNGLLDSLPEIEAPLAIPPQPIAPTNPPPPLHPPEPEWQVSESGKSSTWPKYAAAAAVIALLGGAAAFFLRPASPPPPIVETKQTPSESDRLAEEESTRRKAQEELALQQQAAKEAAEKAARERAEKEQAEKDLAEKERLANEKKAMELAAREKAEKERIAMEEAAKLQAVRDAEALISRAEKIFQDPKSASSEKAQLFPEILKLAHAGNVKAIEICGACYWQGNGVAKDQVEASRWFEKGAELDNSRSMLGLGNCYEQGIGVPKNISKATELWRKAADKGEPLAMSRLGEYYNSNPTDRDIKQAMMWWQKAADLGVPEAMTNLGIHHAAGSAGEKNTTKAIELWEKAVALGEPRAMAELGYLCFNGEVPGKDKSDAFQLFKKAVDANDPRAMTGLGVCYLTGSGTSANRDEAKKWLQKASDLGEPTAAQYLKKLNGE